ncbi:MAG: phospholipase D-like domain-containing protein, partial [Elusimicrobiota bacterium]|nr:phospholipase D-like domain-containing protein [Elusimicrobiota bacterium]
LGFAAAAPARGPVAAAAPTAPRGASVRLNGVALPARLFSDQTQISASLIAAIDASRTSIEIAIHGLALRDVAAALKRAKDRGVRVRIVMNQTHVFPEKERDRREAEVQLLLDEGFEMKMLRGGDMHGAMHNKFAVFDGAVLETGSFNWTAAADRQHYENALFTDEADRLAAFGAYWRWLWERSSPIDERRPPARPVPTPPGEERPRLPDLPAAPAVPGRTVDFNGTALPAQVFSPWSAEASIVAALDAARVSIDVANFSFTSMPLREALLRARDRGVTVRIVLDANQFKYLAEMRELVRLGFDARLSRGKNGERGVQHNKMAVLDGRLVQTGSYNWTTNAHKNNYENVLFLDAPDDAAAYAAYYERIWDQAVEPDDASLEHAEFAPEGAVPAPGSPW